MQYREFSTDNADYVLMFENHKVKGDITPMGRIDALVKESPSSEFEDEFPYFTDYSIHGAKAISHFAKNKIPVFCADCYVSHKPQFMIRDVVDVILQLALFESSFDVISKSHGKVPDFESRFLSDYLFAFQNPRGEGRNAIVAKKTEEFIAPLMGARLGRRPRIGLIYGAGHVGLEYDLKSRRRREFTLFNLKNFNWSSYSGFDRQSLDLVLEANCDKELWTFREHQTGLFPVPVPVDERY